MRLLPDSGNLVLTPEEAMMRKYLFGTWLAKRGLTTQPFSAEKYYRANPDAAYMEIWVIPEKCRSEV